MSDSKKVAFKRYCKTLQLKNDPDSIRMYKQVHKMSAFWPEITEGMKAVGILDMEIYIHENILFMIMDTVLDFSHDQIMNMLAKDPCQKKWEIFVSKFQSTGPDYSVNGKWKLMERIYELDQQQEHLPEEGQLKIPLLYRE